VDFSSAIVLLLLLCVVGCSCFNVYNMGDDVFRGGFKDWPLVQWPRHLCYSSDCSRHMNHVLIHYIRAIRIVRGKRHERLIVRPFHRSTSAAATLDTRTKLFAAEVRRRQQISIDSCCCRTLCGPRNFWSDC